MLQRLSCESGSQLQPGFRERVRTHVCDQHAALHAAYCRLLRSWHRCLTTALCAGEHVDQVTVALAFDENRITVVFNARADSLSVRGRSGALWSSEDMPRTGERQTLLFSRHLPQGVMQLRIGFAAS